MPLQATSGAASYDAFGGGVLSEPNYIESVFSCFLYTGNSSTQTITNGIDLSTKGGLVWSKIRSGGGSHQLIDTARGRAYSLQSNLTDGQTGPSSAPNDLTSFNTDGFSLGVNQNIGINTSGSTYVSWTFRKQPKFFDVVTWTGNGASNRQISHNLGSKPGFIVYKCTSTTGDWNTIARITDTSYSFGLKLNATNAQYVATNPSSTISTTWFVPEYFNGSISDSNANGETYVAYLFAHDAGGFGLTGTDNVISCGSYTGNGSATGPLVDLGYEPQWVMVKQSSASGQWWNMIDVMRGFDVSTGAQTLGANAPDIEYTNAGFGSGTPIMSPTATGFQVRSAQPATNASGATYIYIAIRRGPMKVPTTGASVFEALTYAGNGSTTTGQDINTTFPMDFAFTRYNRSGAGDWDAISRLQGLALAAGTSPYLNPHNANAEATGGYLWQVAQLQLKIYGFSGSTTQLNYLYRRAPGFFDVVCYTGTGAGTSQTHNLSVIPELKIIKSRSGAVDWVVGGSIISGVGGTANSIILNSTAAVSVNSTYWAAADTSTTFSVRTGNGMSDGSGSTYVAYLFATCPGVSKVTNFTGNGTTQAIACGFTGGARFVMIKATSTTGNWLIFDTARGMTTSTDPWLALNSTAAESATTGACTTTTGGFTVDESKLTGINTSGTSYIALAIA